MRADAVVCNRSGLVGMTDAPQMPVDVGLPDANPVRFLGTDNAKNPGAGSSRQPSKPTELQLQALTTFLAAKTRFGQSAHRCARLELVLDRIAFPAYAAAEPC